MMENFHRLGKVAYYIGSQELLDKHTNIMKDFQAPEGMEEVMYRNRALPFSIMDADIKTMRKWCQVYRPQGTLVTDFVRDEVAAYNHKTLGTLLDTMQGLFREMEEL